LRYLDGTERTDLRQSGISNLHTEMFSWQMPMPSAAAVWAAIPTPAILASPPEIPIQLSVLRARSGSCHS
jgi:hypothetical protein